MTVVATVAEQRQLRAEVIAEGFKSWIPCTTVFASDHPGEQTVFAIPSQTRVGVYHLANHQRCGCHDSRRRSGPCKHVRAVRLVLRQLNVIPEYAF